MISSEGTDALVALEDAAPAFMFDRYPGTDVLVWPLLRMQIATSVAEVELRSIPIVRRTRPGQTLVQRIRTAVPSRHSADSLRDQKDFVFLVSGTTYSQSAAGRTNWLVDDHALALGDRAVVLQAAPFDAFTERSARPTNPATYSFEGLALRSRMTATRQLITEEQRAYSERVVDEVYRHLDFPVAQERIATVRNQLSMKIQRALALDTELQPVFDRLQPKAVFIQGAAYGDRSHVIATLKSRGVSVLEHQHGWIGPAHAAYNFGGAMSEPELLATLPDTLLTFGGYWSDAIRFPGATVAVGKPQIERVAHAVPPFAERPRTVLVVSSVADPAETAAFTLSVRDALPESWKVIFRPHPSERTTVSTRYPTLVGQPRISFDENVDLYESLAGARGVIGTASTVLYEALGVGCEVLVRDSQFADMYADRDTFPNRIADEASLVGALGALVSSTTGPAAVDVRRMWKSSSVESFLAFLSHQG